jgi:capsular exopolysaccharide synthesis family protein
MNNVEMISARSVGLLRDGDGIGRRGREEPLGGGLGGNAPSVLAQYLSVLRRRKLLIAGITIGALLLGLVATLLMTPKYTAVATLEIQREARNFTNVEGAESDQTQAVDQEFYETQYGLLKAKSLAERVATELRLYDKPDFFAMYGEETDEMFVDGKPVGGAAARGDRVRAAGEILLDNLSISPARLSRLVEIEFTSPDAGLSKQIVDSWAANFIQATLERRFEATSYARKFLEDRLGQLRSRIDQSERQLVNYASREGIINLPSSTPAAGEGGLTGERSIVADDLAALNREFSRATAERIQAQSRLNAGGGTTDEALENQGISRLRERRAELQAEYAKLMVQFEPDYPPARALRTQIERLDRSVVSEESRVAATLRQTYEASVQREAELRDRVAQLKGGVLDLRRRSIQYGIFQRDADTNRQLYDALLQRYKEIGVAGGVGVNNISVVDPAERPEKPSSPRLLLNLALALLAGLVLGVGAAFALEQIDEALADPAEVEELLGVPLLGTVPKVDESPLEALRDRKSSLSEAYISLQTSLSFSTDHGIPRTVAVTSTRPAEGKSTTSYALARSIARTGRRTLLLDADMRSPSVHHLLGIANREGLSNYLSGNTDDVGALAHLTEHDGLFAMTAGPQPPSAPELLSSDRFAQLLVELTRLFDHVVFDAPPVMGLADAPLVGSRVDGTVFVLESHGTRKSMARVAINRMLAANSVILGAVLTKFDSKRAQYGYGYNYNYSYGYGDRTAARDA